MKTKINIQNPLSSIKFPPLQKRGYYFHADEDFREDWEWGKPEATELPKHNPLKKGKTNGLIK